MEDTKNLKYLRVSGCYASTKLQPRCLYSFLKQNHFIRKDFGIRKPGWLQFAGICLDYALFGPLVCFVSVYFKEVTTISVPNKSKFSASLEVLKTEVRIMMVFIRILYAFWQFSIWCLWPPVGSARASSELVARGSWAIRKML